MILDIDRSLEIGRRLNQPPGHCYWTARRGLKLAPGGVYVEGIAIMEPRMLLQEHAWIEDNGAIIDPSWGADAIRENNNCLGFAYFGAIKLAASEVKGKRLPVFYQYGWSGMDHPGIMAAWAKARGYLDLYAPHSVDFGPFDMDYDFNGFYAPPPPGFTGPGPRPGRVEQGGSGADSGQ